MALESGERICRTRGGPAMVNGGVKHEGIEAPEESKIGKGM